MSTEDKAVVMPHCPLCDSERSESMGPVRIESKGLIAERRICLQCGERYAVDDSGDEV